MCEGCRECMLDSRTNMGPLLSVTKPRNYRIKLLDLMIMSHKEQKSIISWLFRFVSNQNQMLAIMAVLEKFELK